jgi:mannose-1-phosphate guanylyltransferase/phosphomannomutase
MKQAVIICGGRGTRMGPDFASVAKPLIEINGVPLLDLIIEAAARAGIEDVILAAGHLGCQIVQRYNNYSPSGVRLRTIIEESPMGTAGCFRNFFHILDDNFLVLYGDVYIDFDLKALMEDHEVANSVATILIRESDHPDDSDLVELGGDHRRITSFLPKAIRKAGVQYRNNANAAVYACSKKIIEFITGGGELDFATHVFPVMIEAGAIIQAHWLGDLGYVRDIGNTTRLDEVRLYCGRRQAITESREKKMRVRAAILDRDGVIIEDIGLCAVPEDLKFLPGSLEGIRRLRNIGLCCMIATNQPWVARGLVSDEQINFVHEHLKKVVLLTGGEISEIVYSPYHPESHHGEGIRELRRSSECRKPRPGMLWDLMERMSFSPAEVVMIGDSRRDVLASKNAGIRSILIGGDSEAVAAGPDASVDDLVSAAALIEKWNSEFNGNG